VLILGYEIVPWLVTGTDLSLQQRSKNIFHFYWSKKDVFFTYCEISTVFTGPTQFLPVMAKGPDLSHETVLYP